MFRTRATIGICFIWLVSSPASFSQTNDQRIADAIAEIALLKRVVAEQDRRIADLEKAVTALQFTPARNSREAAKDRTAIPPQPSRTAPWKTGPSVWNRIRVGMSRAQVVAILGQPTSVKDAGPYQTLFYQGEVAGSDSVTGTVELADDRVWQVNMPVF